MAGLIGKPHHLVLDAGAIPGAHALNHAAVQGRAVDIVHDDFFSPVVGPAHITDLFVLQLTLGFIGKRRHRLVARLHFQIGKINTGTQHPGRGSGFKTAQPQSQFVQRLRQERCREQSIRAALIGHFPDENPSAQKSAGGQNHRIRQILRIHPGGHLPAAVGGLLQSGDFRLLHLQMLLQFQLVLHNLRILPPVNLRPQRMNRRPLAQIQHPALQKAFIRCFSHLAAQCINFPHQMAFGRAANTGITGAVAHRIHVNGKNHRFTSQPCRRQRRFNARMSGADHRYLKRPCIISHKQTPFLWFT